MVGQPSKNRSLVDSELKEAVEAETHVWQPCDMYAIAALKRKVDKMWDEENERLWQSLPNDEAVHQACIQSLPVLKQRMSRFMGHAHTRCPLFVLGCEHIVNCLV